MKLYSYYFKEKNQLILIDFFPFELKIKNISNKLCLSFLDKVVLFFDFSKNKLFSKNSSNYPIFLDKKSYLKNSICLDEFNKLLFASSKINFLNAFTAKELNYKNEDFLLFINKIKLNLIYSKTFNTSFDEIEKANRWYESIVDNVKMQLVFNELFTNAYEHGNLQIDLNKKNKLLLEDVYLKTIKEIEKRCNKKIKVNIYKVNQYILTEIIDEGEGFDFLSNPNKEVNGRGIYIAKKYSLGVYYNKKGNGVIFVFKA